LARIAAEAERRTATVTDPEVFRNCHQFAAWLGLVPRQSSTGGKERLGGITKWGDAYIRKLLVVASCSLIRYARSKAPMGSWLTGLLDRRPRRSLPSRLPTRRPVSSGPFSSGSGRSGKKP
jgi:transposase